MTKPIRKKKPPPFHWNYRIFRYSNGDIGLHEAYYTNGKLDGWTEDAIIVGEDKKELLEVLDLMRKDILSKKRIIQWPKEKEKIRF